MAQEPDKSSVFTAYLNISKVLIGSGVLALPYAVDQAGLFMSPFLLAFVGVWNAWNVHLLLEAREIAEAICEEKDEFLDEKAIEAGSTYAAVAVIALGPWGGLAIEIGLFVTLIGASASYLITSGELLSETPLGALFSSSMALPMCVLFSALVVLPLVMVRNMGMLAKVSALGDETLPSPDSCIMTHTMAPWLVSISRPLFIACRWPHAGLVACIVGFIAIFYTGTSNGLFLFICS